MIGFLKKQIISLVISLLFGQIPIFKDGFDWDKFIETVKKKVPQWIPGTWFDGAATTIAVNTVYIFKEAVTQDLLKKIVSLSVDGKFQEAWKVIQEAVIKLVSPDLSVAELSEPEVESLFEKSLASRLEEFDTAQA